jgi:hypothetical protein
MAVIHGDVGRQRPELIALFNRWQCHIGHGDALEAPMRASAEARAPAKSAMSDRILPAMSAT